jgi:hypothetical protein
MATLGVFPSRLTESLLRALLHVLCPARWQVPRWPRSTAGQMLPFCAC